VVNDYAERWLDLSEMVGVVVRKTGENRGAWSYIVERIKEITRKIAQTRSKAAGLLARGPLVPVERIEIGQGYSPQECGLLKR